MREKRAFWMNRRRLLLSNNPLHDAVGRWDTMQEKSDYLIVYIHLTPKSGQMVMSTLEDSIASRQASVIEMDLKERACEDTNLSRSDLSVAFGLLLGLLCGFLPSLGTPSWLPELADKCPAASCLLLSLHLLFSGGISPSPSTRLPPLAIPTLLVVHSCVLPAQPLIFSS